MSGAPSTPPAGPTVATDDGDEAALASAFVRALVRQIRAHDTSGMWERKSDAELLSGYVLSREQRRAIPVIADPDPKTVWRIEQFWSAAGLALEQAGGPIATPVVKLTHEGFGRALLICGRLVVASRVMRDVHRFGFDSFTKLASEGEKLINEAMETLKEFPDAARA